jgi:hypothetical protein
MPENAQRNSDLTPLRIRHADYSNLGDRLVSQYFLLDLAWINIGTT